VSLRSRLIVVSDLGDVLVVDVDPGNMASPVNVTAKRTGGLSQPTIGYPAVSGSRLFVADNHLSEYEIVATQQALETKGNTFTNDAFLAPLQLFGTTLVHARQRQGARSITVTGVNLADNKSWQMLLSAPLVSVNGAAEPPSFSALSSDGDLFEVGVDAFKEGIRDQASGGISGPGAQAFGDAVVLPDMKAVLLERAAKGWALQEKRPGGAVQRVNLQVDGDSIAARPAAFGGGILAPLARGSIWLLDPASGAALGGTTPFQPDTQPDTKGKWLPPLVVDERQFVAIDSARKTIYLARYEEKPKPFLALSRPLEVDYEPAHAALLGKTLVVVARGVEKDELVALSVPQLQEMKRQEIEGRIGLRGLEAAGSDAFCVTSTGNLLQVSSGLEIKSRGKLADAPLATAPLVVGKDFLFVAQSGKILRMNSEGGELEVVATAGEPLTGAVQLVGNRLLAGGTEGALHVLPLAAAKSQGGNE
jgi:hypothetical protein